MGFLSSAFRNIKQQMPMIRTMDMQDRNFDGIDDRDQEMNMGRGFPGGPPLMPIRDRRARFPQRGIGSLFDMLRNRRGFPRQQPQFNNNPFGPRPRLVYGGSFSGLPMFGGGGLFSPGFRGGIGGMFPGMGGGYGMRPPSFGGIGGGFNRPRPIRPIRPMPRPIGIGNPIQPIDRPRPMPKPIQVGEPKPIRPRPMPIGIGGPIGIGRPIKPIRPIRPRPVFNKGPDSLKRNQMFISRMPVTAF